MPKKHTTTNLASFTQYVSEFLADNRKVNTVFIDFLKAFDVENHDKIIKQLCKLGIPLNLIKTVESFLVARKHVVLYADYSPKPFTPNSGVPHGFGDLTLL